MIPPALLVLACLAPFEPFGGAHGATSLPALPAPADFPPPHQPPPSPPPSVPTGGGVAGGANGGSHTGPSAPESRPTPPKGAVTGGGGGRPAVTGTPNHGRSPLRPPIGATTALSAPAIDYTTWEYWWQFNRDAFIDLKVHIDALQPRSGPDAAADEAAAWDAVGERILPEVLAALENERDHDPMLASMIALARLCDGRVRARAAQAAAACDQRRTSPNQAVAEGAVVALGVLGHESSVATLCGLLRDTPEARRGLSKKEVPERTRAFAGLSLGLLGARTKNEDLRRFVVHHLAQQLSSEKGAQPDTQAACAIALGLIPLSDESPGDAPALASAPPSASLSSEIELLSRLLVDGNVPLYVRAHLPQALARLASSTRREERVLRVLLERAGDRNEKSEVLQGCMLAIGSLARSGAGALDVAARGLLMQKCATGDPQTRCFATMALAQAAARGEPGPSVDEARAFLLDALQNGRSTRERTWSALALGVLEHARRLGADAPKASAEGLARALRAARSPEEVGALAIGCGLAGARIAIPALLDHLGSVKEVRASGYVALALGMLGAREALDPLHAMLDEARTCSEKLPQTALALALLEDPSLVTRLIALFDKGTSQSTKQAAATALGTVGDRRVLDALLGLLRDETSHASTRGAALAALGRVCDRDRLPWQHAVSEGLNYRAMTATLSDGSHSGLLDLK